MTRLLAVRTLAVLLAVPAFVLLQGYRDVRVQLLAANTEIDLSNRIVTVGAPAPMWPEALLGVAVAVALLALALPGRAPRLAGLLPLLTATALLVVVLVVGLAVVDPPGLQLWTDLDTDDVWLWVRTGVLSPAVPALLGALLVLCGAGVRGVRRDRTSTTQASAAERP